MLSKIDTWKISWESMELVPILGMVNFLTFLCAIITTAYYQTERQMIRETFKNELECCWNPEDVLHEH